MSDFEQPITEVSYFVPEAPDRVVELEAQLQEAREHAARAFGQLQAFKDEVRVTVIEKIRDGTICRPGANEWLESRGLEEYTPRYRVELCIDVNVEVQADDADDARDLARRSVRVEGDSDVLDLDIVEISARGGGGQLG